MKNLFSSFLFVLAIAVSHLGQAQTIRRVNNTGVNPQGVNIYSTLQAAHDAASGGDIIYLEPSGISYGNMTCTKPLTIIGNGYFLAQNPGLQLDLRESIVGDIYFNAGSGGSRITGCTLQGTYLTVNANNVVVERNQINGSAVYVGYSTQTGTSTSVNNIIFRQNYMNSALYLYPSSTQTVSSVIISNNVLISGISSSGAYAQMNSILIANNVVGNAAGNNGAGIQVDNAVIKNNILTYTSTGVFTPRNNSFSYNISGSTAFGTNNGNQQNVTPASMFVGGTASTDGAYQLRTGGSPTNTAIGLGESGTDIGAFGGTTPYRIAGIPNVPSIYQYNQAVSGNSLNATISTRSNN